MASLIWTLTVNGDEEMVNSICIEGIQQNVLIKEMWDVGAKEKKRSENTLKSTLWQSQ